MNLAQLLEGPCVLIYKGRTFESAGGAIVTAGNDAFSIPSDRFGSYARRANNRSIVIDFNLLGVWTDLDLPVLFPYASPQFGEFVTPVKTWDAADVNTGTDVIALAGHGLRAGTPARFGSFGTAPTFTGLTWATDLAYIGAPDADSISLHATEADAIGDANLLDITAAGAGISSLVVQEPLVVYSPTHKTRVTFHVAAVVGMPSLRFSSVQSIFSSPVRFECFGKNNQPWSTANSLFTVDSADLSIDAPDPADIPTQEYALAWGSSPWDSFQSRQAIEVAFNLSLAEVASDQRGLVARKITDLEVTVRAAPDVIESAILDALNLQGGTVGRGVDITGEDFIIAGTGVHVTIYNAGLRTGPLRYNPNDPRAGILEWASIRGITAGVADPVFRAATAAP